MSESSFETPKEIIQLARQLKDLEHQAVAVYEPVVNSIVASRSTDVRQIEQTLDGLLDFAGSDGGLRLFKSLCRYYLCLRQHVSAVEPLPFGCETRRCALPSDGSSCFERSGPHHT